MTELIVADLFAGIGGFTEGAEQAGATVAWVGDYWNFAVQVHAINHPCTVHTCQDLHHARWDHVRELMIDAHPRRGGEYTDLVLAGPSCIPSGQVIETREGLRPIDDVQVGDLVLTHEGRYRAVTNKWVKQYTGDVVSLRVWGDTKQPVKMTTDHLVWVRKREGHDCKLSQPRFVRADELRVGQYVGYARVSEAGGTADTFVRAHAGQCTLPWANSADLWWLLGHWLGDGEARSPYTSKGKPRYTVGWSVGASAKNLARVCAILQAVGLRYRVTGTPNNQRVHTDSKHLHSMCLAFGRLCHDKHVPLYLERLEEPFAVSLIDGYLAADGHIRTRHNKSVDIATSTSLALLQGLQRLSWRLGWTSSISIGDYARECVIEGRTVQAKDTWTISIDRTPHKQSRTKFTDTHMWRSINSIERESVVGLNVYDIEVEEDHTFCLPGVVVHNCQGHSNAGQHARRVSPSVADKHDIDRSTAWAVVSCLEVCRPMWSITENVPEWLKWELFPNWLGTVQALGYHTRVLQLSAHQFGVPQARRRVFVVACRDAARLERAVEYIEHCRRPEAEALGVSSFARWDEGEWKDIELSGHSGKKETARDRLRASLRLAKLGHDRWWCQHVTKHNGRPASVPLSTLTGADSHVLVKSDGLGGAVYRPLLTSEMLAAQGFPATYKIPQCRRRDVCRAVGNAVAVPLARTLVEAVRSAA